MKDKKYDYIIHCITDTYKENPLIKNWVNYHTHGLVKNGLTELSIVVPSNDDRPKFLIDLIAEMMFSGEEFDLNVIHYIDDENGNILFNFILLPAKCYGEDTLRIIINDPNINEIKFAGTDDDSPYVLQFSNIFQIEEDNNCE